MDAVAPALIGLGIFFMYEAYKNTSPTPIEKIKAALGTSLSSETTGSAPESAANAASPSSGGSVASASSGILHP